MSAEIDFEVLGKWEINATIGGDMPGMVKFEHPLFVDDLRKQIQEEYRSGLVPKGIKRGIMTVGPFLKNGRKTLIVYKFEFSVDH